MQFLGTAIGHTAGIGPFYPGDVGGNGLSRGIAGQDLENAERRFQIRHQFVVAHQGHVDLGQGGHQAHVAFIGYQPEGSGFSDGEIGPADPHVGFEEGRPELLAGHFDQCVDIFRVQIAPGNFFKKIAHLIARQMNGRHDHMGRTFLAQLDDPFPQVRLSDDQAFVFQVMVEEGLLRGHGF